jgi:hypothetical protein
MASASLDDGFAINMHGRWKFDFRRVKMDKPFVVKDIR